MIPDELSAEYLDLPDLDNNQIVLITGNQLRHKRFALRMIEEFGDQVVAWYQVENSAPRRFEGNQQAKNSAPEGLKAKLIKTAKSSKKFARQPGLWALFVAVVRGLLLKFRWQMHSKAIQRGEERLFGREVHRLQATMNRQPSIINPKDVNTAGFVAEIKALNAYFFLSLAGPLYGKELLDSIRGIAINQHAGHSPVYKGTSTIEWALYRRDLRCVSATVHQTTSGADNGPILRRSAPCLFPGDSPSAIFSRVVALGTELMIEVVREIMADKHVRVYPQPDGAGQTYLGTHMTPHVLNAIYRDHRAGWLRDEFVRLKQF